jgi:hypothetical protein
VIYFQATIAALQAHIASLQSQLAASESERRELQDRLLLKANSTAIIEREPSIVPKLPNIQYIAPPGINPLEIQDAMKDVWIQNEMNHFIEVEGWDYDRARGQAEQNYQDQHGYKN